MDPVEKYLGNQVTRGRTPSLQYSFFNNDSCLFTFRSGLADVGNQRPVDERTTCHFFSITKTITALAVLQLVDLGLVEIEKPVKEYFSEFNYGDGITIKQLLNHSAGLPNPIPLSWSHLAEEHSTFNQNEFFKKIINHNTSLRSKPNDRFSYSNLNYIILGRVIEAVSGKPYESFIRENIFSRLALQENDIGFTIPDFNKHSVGYHPRWSISNLILGLLLDRSKFMAKAEGAWVPFNKFYVNGAAYGGALGTLDALVKYGQELLKPAGNLISDQARTALFTENFTNNGKSTGMCLSWFKASLNADTYFAHAGGGGGYYSEIRLYPKLGRGSALLLNRTGFRDERFLDQLDKFFLK